MKFEQVKQIAETCGFVFYDMTNVNGENLGKSVESDSWESITAFTDHIVKMCCDIAYDADESNVHGYGFGSMIADTIKERFGLE